MSKKVSIKSIFLGKHLVGSRSVFFRWSDPDRVFSSRLDPNQGFFSRKLDPIPINTKRLHPKPWFNPIIEWNPRQRGRQELRQNMEIPKHAQLCYELKVYLLQKKST